MVFDVDHVYHCVTQLSTALGHRRLFNGDTAYNWNSLVILGYIRHMALWVYASVLIWKWLDEK